MTDRQYHAPIGDPCTTCGMPAYNHRVEHPFQGTDWCDRCGLEEKRHRARRKEARISTFHLPKGDPCTHCGKAKDVHWTRHRFLANVNSPANDGDPLRCVHCDLTRDRHIEVNAETRVKNNRARNVHAREHPLYMGIDGEGIGRDPHRYVYLGINDTENKRARGIANINGLTTIECLNFILSIPKHAKLFAYAFNYDLTMMLRDVDDETLYKLARPETHPRLAEEKIKGPTPLPWNGYWLNLQGTKFTVTKGKGKNRQHVVIWDIFRFFQGKFVKALKEWKVGDETLWKRMTAMKDQRGDFEAVYAKEPEKVQAYCLEECMCMAQLARKLTQAHEDIGLTLPGYYGAGSSASAMLKVMGIKEQIGRAPVEMERAIAQAFFGGRFENSVIGKIDGIIHNYDISSAYPYQLTFLPCLLHGRWRLVKTRKQVEGINVKTALVRYRLRTSKTKDWGPFPYRNSKGEICFPVESGGGWVWRDEYLAGERMFPQVQFREAWIYECECACQPFAKIPEYYAERLRIGKEAKGLCLKLGCNSCYGKLAQSVGTAIFNSWIWAGMITSGTRAQILDVLALHDDRANMLMVATDGIYTREKLKMPKPRETGTGFEYEKDGVIKRTPLGGWEHKIEKNGMFVAKPGIYFPLNPTEKQLDTVRARGIGKGHIFSNHAKIVDTWNKHGLFTLTDEGEEYTKVVIGEAEEIIRERLLRQSVEPREAHRRAHEEAEKNALPRFHGMKTSTTRRGAEGEYSYHRSPNFGQWSNRTIEMSFRVLPKRDWVNEDGHTLKVRRMPLDLESMPYKKALPKTEDGELTELDILEDDIDREQPEHENNQRDTFDTDST